MRGKLAFVVGAAVGYVLGTRAGRERYEQIKRVAKKVWNTEPVQKGVHAVKGAADDRADELKQAALRLGSQLLGKMSEQAADKSRAKPAKGEKPAGSGGPKMKSSAAARATEAAETDEAEPDQAKS